MELKPPPERSRLPQSGRFPRCASSRSSRPRVTASELEPVLLEEEGVPFTVLTVRILLLGHFLEVDLPVLFRYNQEPVLLKVDIGVPDFLALLTS